MSIDRLTGARSDYSYDAANRLTKVTGYHGHTYTYGHDANGNRTSVTIDGTTTQTLAVNAGNQLTTSGYSFDGAGQQTHDPTAGALGYNAAGQMTSQDNGSTDTTYTWAGTGMNELRSTKATGGDEYDYVYGRTDPNGVLVLDSIAKNGAVNYLDNDPAGTPLALHLSGGQADYYVRDGHGSIVALVDSNSTTQATYTYDPYGITTAQTGSGTAADLNPYRYTGGILDHATGWLKHGTRWNDTTTGRWTTPDPLTHLNNPDQANPYQYAAGDPINIIDPTGELTTGEKIAVSLIVGGAIVAGTGGIGLAGAGAIFSFAAGTESVSIAGLAGIGGGTLISTAGGILAGFVG